MRVALALIFPIAILGLIAFFIYGLTPPAGIRLATGINGGGYWQIGERYKAALARDGIAVELIETEGAVANIQKLRAGDADVAFVQGGLKLPGDGGLQSLGAIFLEPVAIFRQASSNLSANPGEWRGVRLAVGPEGSGTRAAAVALIEAAGLQNAGIVLVDAGGAEAIAALRANEADALLFVAPLDAPYLMDAIFDPEVAFVPMDLIEAIALNLPGARSVTIPAGSISLDPPRPAAAVDMLALTASMIGSESLHPAITDRLVQAAMAIHGDRSILNASREFPNAESPPVPINEVAWELITSGPNVLHKYFPYWIAAQFGRVLLLLLPLLFLAPLLRIVPAAYIWFQKRRIWRHYERIAAIEVDLEQALTRGEVEGIADSLEEIDSSLANLSLPLAYRQGAYDARLHIDLIRQEIRRRQTAPDAS